MDWCIKIKATTLTLAFALYMFLCVVLIENTRAASLDGWTNIGQSTLADLLEIYLSHNDKEEADYEIDVWIDGWTDGLLSVYVYEGVIDELSISQLDVCMSRMTPESMRNGLLSLALDDDTKRLSVAKVLYIAVHTNCEDVFGPYDTTDGTSS